MNIDGMHNVQWFVDVWKLTSWQEYHNWREEEKNITNIRGVQEKTRLVSMVVGQKLYRRHSHKTTKYIMIIILVCKAKVYSIRSEIGPRQACTPPQSNQGLFWLHQERHLIRQSREINDWFNTVGHTISYFSCAFDSKVTFSNIAVKYTMYIISVHNHWEMYIHQTESGRIKYR